MKYSSLSFHVNTNSLSFYERGCGTWRADSHDVLRFWNSVLVLVKAELSVADIALLTDGDLQQLGVAAMGPRRRILAAAALQQRQPAGSHADAQRSEASSAATDMGPGLAAGPAAEPQARLQGSVLAFGSSTLSCGAPRTGFITDFFGCKAGPKPPQPQQREGCPPAQAAKQQKRAGTTWKARPGTLGYA